MRIRIEKAQGFVVEFQVGVEGEGEKKGVETGSEEG